MNHKVYDSAEAALEGIVKDGDTLAVGGFGLCGIPEALIAALKEALHSGIHSSSFNPKKSKNTFCKLGIVASPTPIFGISGDSTKEIFTLLPKALER